MSQADDWRWGEDVITKKSVWDRVRTLSLHAEPIVKLLEVPGAFVPGANAALEKLRALLPEDLNFSALDHPAAISPLPGRDVLKSRDGTEPVFIDGFKASFRLEHNGKGSKDILLEWMDVQMLSFTEGSDPFYERQIDEVAPAGTVQPRRIFVEVGADGPDHARMKLDGCSEMAVANSNNFFDTDDGSLLTFAKDGKPEVIKVTLRALDAGLYDLLFSFIYSVGTERRQYRTQSLSVYCA